MTLTGILLILAITGIAHDGTPLTKLKIDTVPDEYRPTNTMIIEPVSMESFHFEVNPETSRARVVVTYTYPDRIVFESDDDTRGPEPTIVQIPGLTYDPRAHTVLYEADGKQTVCAHVQESRGLFGVRLRVANTGRCLVTANHARRAEDDGWMIRHFSAIDTYFEVH